MIHWIHSLYGIMLCRRHAENKRLWKICFFVPTLFNVYLSYSKYCDKHQISSTLQHIFINWKVRMGGNAKRPKLQKSATNLPKTAVWTKAL